MQIIISGGSGFIGRQLTQSLLARGHQVIILSRNPERVAASLPAGATAQQWDAKTARGWGHMIDESDVIINLAGESIAGTGVLPSRWTSARKQVILQSRINAGEAIVQAIDRATHKPDVLIQASAIGIYGPRGDDIITEKSPLGEDFLGETAKRWEASTAPVEAMGVRRVITRTGIIMSMESGPLPFSVFQFKTFTGGRLGSGRQWMPWIHLEDVVSATRFLMETPHAQGPYNLCAPAPVTNTEYSEILAEVLGRPNVFFVPATALRLSLGEIATTVLDGQRAVPENLLELGFQFHYPTLKTALEDLLA